MRLKSLEISDTLDRATNIMAHKDSYGPREIAEVITDLIRAIVLYETDRSARQRFEISYATALKCCAALNGLRDLFELDDTDLGLRQAA